MKTRYYIAYMLMVLGPLYAQVGIAQTKPAAQTMAERLANLELKVLVLEVQALGFRDVSARLDCDTKRFGSAQSSDPAKLLVLVSCESVEPYLEGYRITLHVGNPYSVTISGLRGTLHYGTSSSRKTAEIPLSSGLQPGRWTSAVVGLSKARASEITDLQATFQVEHLTMRGY